MAKMGVCSYVPSNDYFFLKGEWRNPVYARALQLSELTGESSVSIAQPINGVAEERISGATRDPEAPEAKTRAVVIDEPEVALAGGDPPRIRGSLYSNERWRQLGGPSPAC